MKQIEIPIKAISENQIWQGRRFKTKKYKDWQKDFALLVGKNNPIKGNIAITYEFYIKHDKTTDHHNLIKGLNDTLKDCGIIEDDRFIYESHEYKYHSEKEFIRLTISEL